MSERPTPGYSFNLDTTAESVMNLEVIAALLAAALREAVAEIAYWLPDYLEGGRYYEHPRGSGPDRVSKLGREALAQLDAWMERQ